MNVSDNTILLEQINFAITSQECRSNRSFENI